MQKLLERFSQASEGDVLAGRSSGESLSICLEILRKPDLTDQSDDEHDGQQGAGKDDG